MAQFMNIEWQGIKQLWQKQRVVLLLCLSNLGIGYAGNITFIAREKVHSEAWPLYDAIVEQAGCMRMHSIYSLQEK